jgi:hypothetical protein
MTAFTVHGNTGVACFLSNGLHPDVPRMGEPFAGLYHQIPRSIRKMAPSLAVYPNMQRKKKKWHSIAENGTPRPSPGIRKYSTALHASLG